MKKLILTLLFSLTLFANSDSCKLDVYFGNGVWNSPKQAEASMKELRRFMRLKNYTRFSVPDEGTTYSFKYAYNPEHGTTDDLIETYWQLYESGQISEGYFENMTSGLSGFNSNSSLYAQKITSIISTYNINVTTMIEGYRKDSLDLKHNVLLVAHSQGNLFGNKMYSLLTDEEKMKFQMVSVATPANNVAGNYVKSAPYTTVMGDLIIAGVLNSFAANASGSGHSFVDSYLKSRITPTRVKINSDITNAVNLLDKNSCKKKYDYYSFISYMCPTRQDQELVVDIYGTQIKSNTNTLVEEEYVTSDIRVRAFEDPVYTVSSTTGNGSGTIIVPSGTGKCPLTSDDFRSQVSHYDKMGVLLIRLQIRQKISQNI